MHTTTGIAPERPKDIASGLLEVWLETRALRLRTHDFQWRLRGPICKALQLLLDQQQDELRRAEAVVTLYRWRAQGLSCSLSAGQSRGGPGRVVVNCAHDRSFLLDAEGSAPLRSTGSSAIQTSYRSIDSTRSSGSRRPTRPETQMGIRNAERDAICETKCVRRLSTRVVEGFTTTDAFIASNWCSLDARLNGAPRGRSRDSGFTRFLPSVR